MSVSAGEVDGVPNSRKGFQKLGAPRNDRHLSCFGYVSLHSGGCSTESGPITVWLPWMSPDPQDSSVPHVGGIGGRWRYSVGVLQFVSPLSLLCR